MEVSIQPAGNSAATVIEVATAGAATTIVSVTPTPRIDITIDRGVIGPEGPVGPQGPVGPVGPPGSGVSSVAALTLGTTGSDLTSTVANPTTTPVITLNVPSASASNRGVLTAADWTTFNSKGNGTVTSVTGTLGRTTSTGGITPAIDLASGIVSAGTTGSATLVPVITVDTYGRVTGITTAANPQGTVTSVSGTAPVVSSGGTTPAISMAAATTSVSGYLTSTDWTTFNNKGSGTVTSVAALTLGTTGTDLSSTVATGTTTPVITLNVPTASATNRGALSAADWTTFNGKGSGTITSVTGTAPVVSSGGTTPAISMAAATASVSGYLTSTDWTTFNNKGSGTVTGVTGTAPIVSSGGAAPAISIPAATASVNGYLTSADWTTFNGKGSGTVTSVTGVTGRTTSTGGATPAIDLASGIATPGTTGSASLVPVVTVDTYGRVTSITTAANPQGTVTSVTGTTPVVSSGGATPAISMPVATTSVDGYLSATDWTTFNGKQAAGAYLTAVTADAPLTGSGTSASHLSIPVATTSVSGYLSSTDWTTFNNKGSGTVTSVSGTAPVYRQAVLRQQFRWQRQRQALAVI